jgi:glycosyltransferase involved in cell wall biosynthesis
MIGQRGVPATFGGIERHVEELGAQLAGLGHAVTVYCRTNYVEGSPAEYRGMQLRYSPSVDSKHFDAISHSLVCTLAALPQHFDIVHFHALGPGLVAPVPRYVSRAKVVQTAHGRDEQRGKWGPLARTVLGTARWMSARVPDATIAVSHDLVDFYATRYHRRADYIPNGVVAPVPRPPSETLQRLGLAPRKYVLFVGRLVPEKAPDLLIRAFADLPGDLRLAIVGGSSHTTAYVGQLEALAADDPRVALVGYQYGDALDELYSNALAFALPSSLEGLPITLLEAGASGLPIVASDIAPHLEILGPDDRPGRRLFSANHREELVAALGRVLSDPAGERRAAEAFIDEVVSTYRWDETASRTVEVYRRVLGSVDSDSAKFARATE